LAQLPNHSPSENFTVSAHKIKDIMTRAGIMLQFSLIIQDLQSMALSLFDGTVFFSPHKHVLNSDLIKIISFQVLSAQTKKCLSHPAFKEVTLQSLIFFLQQDSLTVNSEMDLIIACLSLSPK
jgi:BTB And C-terminal Kelch